MSALFSLLLTGMLFLSPLHGVLITHQEFERAVTSNHFPTPTVQQYTTMVSKAGTRGRISTKRELAMFLANVLQETGGLRFKEELRSSRGDSSAYANRQLDAPGKLYHGRGYMQLSYAYNYKPASLALYGDLRLLNNPEQVATNEEVAWDTAFWFWANRVHQASGVSEGQFGATTKMINGDECKNGGSPKARNRFKMYAKVYQAFGLSGNPDGRGCYF